MNADPVQQADGPREHASQASALFAVLQGQPADTYVELTPPGAGASRQAREFAAAGWSGLQAATDAETDIDALLDNAGMAAPCWMAVRGNAAVRALASWRGSCRPAVVLVDAGPLPLSAAAAPPWRATLARLGYLYAINDDGCDHFVHAGQTLLLERLAEQASLTWRMRLQASRSALAQAQRDAEQTRSALLMAQADGMAAHARATMLQQQIEAIHASASWKSTKPLRWAARLRREPGPALRQLRTVARARVAALAGKSLRRVAAKVNGSPALHARVAALSARHPALRRHLQALLHLGAAVPDAAGPASPSAIDASNVVGPHFKDLLLDELGRPGTEDQ